MAKRRAASKTAGRARKPAKPARRARAASRKTVKPVPDGYRTVTPYLTVSDGAAALGFYQRAFGARELRRLSGPGGRLMHAEIRIGDSIVMLSDEQPGTGTRSPQSLGGTTGSVFLYVPNVDALFARAVAAGARALMPPTDMFWGDRFGQLVDPFGHQWGLATHREDVPPAEMARRAQAAMAPRDGGAA